ncbi:ScbA/BarX family gamma-butyrolactone biosynthesis protein [Kitasatospora sp. NPDC056531]|uniref:ScbA/BarX family gamma-butyrolactone biosynthesis protein n=1 Tax=Kitasatospora sp. NPDC056531 TaxID=3345856 RepID=UPI00367C11F8
MVEATLTAPDALHIQDESGIATLEMLHRTCAQDAFLHGWRKTASDTFVLTGQWPAHHRFFQLTAGRRVDPLLVAETLRQSVHLVVHAGYGVPVGHAFILQNIRFHCLPDRLAIGAGPVDLEVRISIPGYRSRDTRLFEAEIEIQLAGITVAGGGIDFQVVSPGVYRRLRGGRTGLASVRPTTPAVAAALVGRARSEDVLLSATPQEQTWQLRIDTGHKTLFQSPKDHAPGMLLLEAARQAATAVSQPGTFIPWAADASFFSYVELNEACSIQAHEFTDAATGKRAVRVTAHQSDRSVFQATLRDARADIG